MRASNGAPKLLRMTQHMIATKSDLATDTQTMPPFRAIDALSGEIDRLDSWVSSFIGRLQPYRVEENVVMEGADLEPAEKASAFEQRVHEQRRRITSIIEALDTMNQGLRL